MDLKYYDLLSTAIIGVVFMAIINYLYLDNIEVDSIAYLALGYLIGYFVNSIGSLLEGIYYKTIKGRPSDCLLTLEEGHPWTGCQRVKFYEAEKAINMLKLELNDQKVSTQKMFRCAMSKVNACENSKVPTFNAQYVWSRTILTFILIIDIFCAFRFYDDWIFWIVAVVFLLISWNRFKEMGYYYAREVLIEYLKQANNCF